jgi:hypothetical protein
VSASNALKRGCQILARYLEWARRHGESVPDAEVYEVLGPDAVASVVRGFLHQRRELAGCRLVSNPIEEVPGRIVADAIDGNGERMRAVAVVRDDGNAHVMFAKALPDGFVLREASALDGPRLAEVCRTTPIVTGPIRTTTDYGPDYLRSTELADERIVLLVEADGRIVGMHGCVIHEAVVGDHHGKLAYLRHTRIDRAAQGHGVFSALNGALFARGFASGALPYSLVAVGNDRMLEKLPEELRRWPWRHNRFHLDTRKLADRSSALVEIDPIDAVPLINRVHDGATLRPATTSSALRRRLQKAPHLYGSDRLLGDPDAVIGVSREPIYVTTEGPNGAQGRREAVAYDVGATSLDAFERVVRSWCHRLAAEGVHDLAIDTSTASPLHNCLATLARSAREYALQLALPPPPQATGFWIDPAYI